MKLTIKLTFFLFFFSMFIAESALAQGNVWTQRQNFPGSGRAYAAGFAIGSKGYVFTGQNSTNTLLKDVWEYNSVTNTWVQKANFPGTPRKWATAFAINNKGYLLGGQDSTAFAKKDLWEYDPLTDAWTQKADFPGVMPYGHSFFVIGNNAYCGLGYNARDLWEYNPTTNVWTKKLDFPVNGASFASTFSASGKGYVIGGSIGTALYEYNPSSNTWAYKTDSAAVRSRSEGLGFSLANQGYVALGGSDFNATADLWSYNPLTNSFTKRADMSTQNRTGAVGFVINQKLYVVTGQEPFYQYPQTCFSYEDAVVTRSLVAELPTTSFCASSSAKFVVKISSPFDNGNVYTAQLSNSSGSFSSPTVLGSLSSTSQDTLNVIFPSNLSASTNYKIRLVATNPVFIGDTISGITIGTNPNTGAIVGDSLVFVGATNKYFVPKTIGSSYKWFFGNGTGISNSDSIQINWNSAGSTIIKLVETSSIGCKGDTVRKNIIISTPTILMGTFSNTICAGNTVKIPFAYAGFIGATNFEVKLSDVNGNFVSSTTIGSINKSDKTGTDSILVSFPIFLSTGSNYEIRIESGVTNILSNSAKKTIGAKPVTSNIIGDSIVNQNDTVIYSVLNTAGSSYVWSYTNGIGSINTNTVQIIWNMLGNSNLRVIETSAFGCKGDTVTKSIIINTAIGLKEVRQNEVKIYPNPSNGELAIELKTTEKTNFKIIDIAGKIVREGIIVNGYLTLDETSSLANDNYIIVVGDSMFKWQKR